MEKTQAIDINWGILLCCLGIVVFAIIILLIHKIRYQKWIKPVSYTHLDVYKRQLYILFFGGMELLFEAYQIHRFEKKSAIRSLK